MFRPAIAVVGALLVAALSGCSSDDEGDLEPDSQVSVSSPASDAPAPEPDLTPLPEASVTDALPDPLKDTPSLNRALDVAEAGNSRLEGEQFALEVAHLIMDVRESSDANALFESLSSPDIDPKIEKFLAGDVERQRQIGTERHYNTDVNMWIRSQVIGSDTLPNRINAEIAGITVSEPLELSAWYRTRVDVVWQDNRWQLIGYSSGDYGPDTSANLTDQQRADYLQGPGWREIVRS